MANKKLSPFGMRELWIAKILTDETGATTYEELVRCEGVKELTITPTISEYLNEGDDRILETDAVLEGYDWSFTNAIFTYDQLAVLEGGTFAAIMEDTTEVGQRYTNANTDQLPYFGMVGKIVKGGEQRIVLFKCKATGGVEISFANKEYAEVSASGKAIARNSDGNIRKFENYNATQPALTNTIFN
jgi:hypothetical protein